MPRACPVVRYVSRYDGQKWCVWPVCSGEREPPRDKPVASMRAKPVCSGEREPPRDKPVASMRAKPVCSGEREPPR
ncbi:MAG: hypothetical protein ACQESR_22955, partial [Planctomycetota bacterium]